VVMVIFGRPWLPDPVIHARTPVGQACAQCAEPIGPDDRGRYASALRFERGALVEVTAPVHMECDIRCAVGGAPHLFNGGTTPWRGTYRQEALRVVAALNEVRQRSQAEPL